MFCPGCGIQTNEDLKFCKQCGANLHSVREVMLGKSGGSFDWSKTWVAEMFLTEEERERQKGVTPEEKRYKEIKDGVITCFVGVGVMIFLYFLLGAIAEVVASKDPEAAGIVRHIWVAGVIPFLVGIGLIINGLFISKRIVEVKRRQTQAPPQPTPLGAASTAQLSESSAPPLSGFSVTEPTTTRLKEPLPVPSRRDTN